MFTRETLRFLRALERHTDREWFRARRDQYEAHVRGPMIALIERIAGELPALAPELVASPRVSLYRIYRDTRFSSDKKPFKTHVAAIFPCRGMPRHESAGFYVEVSPDVPLAGRHSRTAAGASSGRPRHTAGNFRRFQTIVESPGSVERSAVSKVSVPACASASKDHPPPITRAYGVSRAADAMSRVRDDARFYREIIRRFTQMAPLVVSERTALARRRRLSTRGRVPIRASGARPQTGSGEAR
jgi:uncharacterized protein (TIGR02453 family)